jgi:hypothetical protein
MYRQGDILLIPIQALPERLVAVTRDDGRVVLAYGEATGHAHAIHARGAALFREDGSLPGGSMFLRLAEAAELRHEEHAPIALPSGLYRVVRQREYAPDAVRNVED